MLESKVIQVILFKKIRNGMGVIEELRSYGFEEVGDWKLDKDTKAKIRFKFKNKEYENKVVYCFIVESEVKYIGNM